MTPLPFFRIADSWELKLKRVEIYFTSRIFLGVGCGMWDVGCCHPQKRETPEARSPKPKAYLRIRCRVYLGLGAAVDIQSRAGYDMFIC